MDKSVDLLIAGAGPVGAASALLGQILGFTSRWISPAPTTIDSRLMALSPRSVHYLKRLGVWAHIPQESSTAIRQVKIHKNGRNVYTLNASDYQLSALGNTVSLAALMQGFNKTLQIRNVQLDEGWQVDSWDHLDEGVSCKLSHLHGQQEQVQMPMLIMASGAPTATNQESTTPETPYKWRSIWSWLLPQQEAEGIIHHNYAMSGWMISAKNASLKPQTAIECFEDDGVVAIIPGADHTFKVIVLKENPGIDEPDEEQIIAWLSKAYPLPQASWEFSSTIQPFSPSLQYRKSTVDNHTVWLGNAAHTLSPVGGQGLNIGLHEVWCLMECLATYGISEKALQHYAHELHTETMAAISATHWMTQAHQLPQPITQLAGRLLPHVPVVSRIIGARLMFGRRAWLSGLR